MPYTSKPIVVLKAEPPKLLPRSRARAPYSYIVLEGKNRYLFRYDVPFEPNAGYIAIPNPKQSHGVFNFGINYV